MNNSVPIQRFIKKTMRLTVTQLFLSAVFCSLSLANNSKAQKVLQKEVSIHMESAEIRRILGQIEQQTNVKFIYSTQSIQPTQTASINVAGRSLSRVLDELLVPINVEYKVIDSRIILQKKKGRKICRPNFRSSTGPAIEGKGYGRGRRGPARGEHSDQGNTDRYHYECIRRLLPGYKR